MVSEKRRGEINERCQRFLEDETPKEVSQIAIFSSTDNIISCAHNINNTTRLTPRMEIVAEDNISCSTTNDCRYRLAIF
jgi:hypothetical protein